MMAVLDMVTLLALATTLEMAEAVLEFWAGDDGSSVALIGPVTH